jgi:CarD family transcriptional regulator
MGPQWRLDSARSRAQVSLDGINFPGICSGVVCFLITRLGNRLNPYKPMTSMPSFQVGDKVVYPNHGIGIVDQIATRTNGFQVERFYMLTIKASALKVMVPCGNVLTVGLRRVVRQEEVNNILAFLGDDQCNSNADWKERYREHCEKMKAGSLMEVAEVLKSLLVLNKKKTLGFREQKMLEKARYLLVNEITQAMGRNEDSVDDELIASLQRAELRFPDIAGAA